MKTLFVVTACITALLGIGWLLIPSTMLSLWDVPADDVTLYVSRRYAGLYLGYSVVMWLSRLSPPSPARRAIVAGGFVVTCIMGLLSLYGVLTGIIGPGAWRSVGIEVLLAAGFGYFLFSDRRPDSSGPSAA